MLHPYSTLAMGHILRRLERDLPADTGCPVREVNTKVLTEVTAFVNLMPNRAVGLGRDAFQVAVSRVHWTMELFPTEIRLQALTAISMWFVYLDHLKFVHNRLHRHRRKLCTDLHRISALFDHSLLFTSRLPEADSDLAFTWALRQRLLGLLSFDVVTRAFTAIRDVVEALLELSFRQTLPHGNPMDYFRVYATAAGMGPCFPILAQPILECDLETSRLRSETFYWFEWSAMQLTGLQTLAFSPIMFLAPQNQRHAQHHVPKSDTDTRLSVLRAITKEHRSVMQRALHAAAVLSGCGPTDAQQLYSNQVFQLIRTHFYAQLKRTPCREVMNYGYSDSTNDQSVARPYY